MTWQSTGLWADEEKRIHWCITEALNRLIASRSVSSDDDELVVSGRLRPTLYRVRKEQRLDWTLHSEASSFKSPDAPKPIGHPDFRFSRIDTEYDQYNYDIECKLVRIKRSYCKYYVTDGVQRYREGKYAQSFPIMGAMIGYVQEGDWLLLLNAVNQIAVGQGLKAIELQGEIKNGSVTHLIQQLHRDQVGDFVLAHLWADFRVCESITKD